MVPVPGMSGRSRAVAHAGWEVVDRRHGIEGAEPCGQAAGRGSVAPGAIGEAERRLLGDGGGPLDLDPVTLRPEETLERPASPLRVVVARRQTCS